MITVNIHEAKANLSRLVEGAAKGESFIIAKAGKPMVKVVALDVAIDLANDVAVQSQPARLGFLAGQIKVPDDFDTMGSAAIESLFGAT